MFQQKHLDGASARGWGWFENLLIGSIDGWTELRQQFTTRFSTRRACFKDPTEITRIARKANETLVAFKERWIVETGFIVGVPEVMKISSFMDAHKCPELAKRYSDKVLKTVDEMMVRLDDFVRSEEAFSSMKLPKGESRKTKERWEERLQHQGWSSSIPTANPQRGPSRVSSLEAKPKLTHQATQGNTSFEVTVKLTASTTDAAPAQERKLGQLEMGLESGKLNHLINDVRQRGRGNGKGRDNEKDKMINMIRSWSDDRKRKAIKCDKSWIKAPIIFPPVSMEDSSDEPLIIEVVTEGYLVRRVCVDQGVLVEVMFEHCFKNLSPAMRSRLKSTQMDLVGFVGGVVKPLGKIELEVVFGDGGLFRRIMINFTVFPTPRGIATLVTRTMIISECRRIEKMIDNNTRRKTRSEEDGKERVDLAEQVLVNPSYPDQLVTIGVNLSEWCKSQLKALLKRNLDIFAWEPDDMIEVEEWLKARIIHPVRYPIWISNPVLVNKGDGSWRMYIDFKNLNSACPKDYYPLPDIDGKIESVAGFRYKCFLNGYKGFHQRLVDTAFQSQIGRNIEAYVDDMVIKSNDERMIIADITETFDNLITQLSSINSDMSSSNTSSIKKAFNPNNNLWKINMKLNPKKCSYRVEEGKFLGYMVTSEGIRANPKKTKAIADMQSPRTLKEMQSLSGKLAAPKRFLS
ncbi:hypothetical protein Tco_0045975 [Tanacetum coccineum]